MIGIIITGNGEIASSIVNSLELLNGDTEEMYSLNYSENKTQEEYDNRLRVLVDDLLTRCSSVIIMSDLTAGHTFIGSKKIANEYENVGVYAPTSLQVALEISAARYYIEDPYELLATVVADTRKSYISYNHNEYTIE